MGSAYSVLACNSLEQRQHCEAACCKTVQHSSQRHTTHFAPRQSIVCCTAKSCFAWRWHALLTNSRACSSSAEGLVKGAGAAQHDMAVPLQVIASVHFGMQLSSTEWNRCPDSAGP